MSIRTCALVEICLANDTNFMYSPDTHKNDVCTIDRAEKRISFSFSLLLKYIAHPALLW